MEARRPDVDNCEMQSFGVYYLAYLFYLKRKESF